MKLKIKPTIEFKDSDVSRVSRAELCTVLRDWSNLNLATLGGPRALLTTLRLQHCWHSWAGIPAAF